MCKEIGAELAEKKHAPLLANQVAVELGLVDPSGPTVVLEQSIESLGQRPANELTPPNVVYMYLLNACEKLFDSEMDQATFEEHMRWFFGTKVRGWLVPFLVRRRAKVRVSIAGLSFIHLGQIDHGVHQTGKGYIHRDEMRWILMLLDSRFRL